MCVMRSNNEAYNKSELRAAKQHRDKGFSYPLQVSETVSICMGAKQMARPPAVGRGLITPLITTHEPPSIVNLGLGRRH